jgi:hypothetical protein
MGMRLSDIVFVPSIQHTGTWFLLGILQNFFEKTKELTFLLENNEKQESEDCFYRHQYQAPLDKRTIAHIHLPIVRHLNFDVNFPEGEFQNRWFRNLGTLRSVPVDTIKTLCNFFKVVIPIRDPMAAILTREARHPQFRHFYIVDGFVVLATELIKHPNVMFFPVDLYDNVQDRKGLLVRLLVHLGIDITGKEELLDTIAREWSVKNITPGNKFKALYKKGDLNSLMSMLGPKQAEVEYLQNMSSIIMPFMAGLGYTREKLVW